MKLIREEVENVEVITEGKGSTKRMYIEGEHSETATKKAVMGALSLYLDFLNLFMMLLHLFGDRR